MKIALTGRWPVTAFNQPFEVWTPWKWIDIWPCCSLWEETMWRALYIQLLKDIFIRWREAYFIRDKGKDKKFYDPKIFQQTN